MGVSNKKTKTTQQQQTSSVTTPTNPAWVTDAVQGLAGQIGALGQTDPQSYVAGPSALQRQAYERAGGLGTSSRYGDAADLVGQATGAGPASLGRIDLGGASTYEAQSLLDGLMDYVNPQLQGIVDPSLANYDYEAGKTRAAAAAKGALNNAFGGSRYGIAEAELGSGLTRNRALTEAELRSTAFDNAYNYSSQDAARRQQAAADNAAAKNRRRELQGQLDYQTGEFNANSRNSYLDRLLSGAGLLGNIGTAEDTSNRANIGLLADLGAQERDIEQARATAPLSLLQAQQALLSGLPLGLFTGQQSNGTSSGTSTTTQNPGLLATIGQGLQAGASLASLFAGAPGAGNALSGMSQLNKFSDRRLKRDIKRIGVRDDGLNVYSYRYVWGGARHEGVMADEVIKVRPQAVIHDESGYLKVNYGAL